MEGGGDDDAPLQRPRRARREVASAARRMPKMAPSVPPMSSTESMMVCRTSNTEPRFARPESSFLRMAGVLGLVSVLHYGGM